MAGTAGPRGSPIMPRHDGRAVDQLRPVTIERGFLRNCPGSALYRAGGTTVLVSAHLSDEVPPFLVGRNSGWLTAEYAMLPGSTPTRKKRGPDATPDDNPVTSITNAPEPLADDIARRQLRYLIQMGIRVVCFVLAVVTWGHLPLWVSLVFIVAAVVLPYFAVIGANAGRERQDSDASFLEQRQIGPGHGPGELGGRREGLIHPFDLRERQRRHSCGIVGNPVYFFCQRPDFLPDLPGRFRDLTR